MRLASNKLKDILGFYDSELKDLYDQSEITAMAALAAEHYLGYSRSDLVTKADANINQSALIKLYDCAKALKEGVPLQYILGEAFFYGLTFRVNRQVLIPRPETEELVDLVLGENTQAVSFLDIGTGSGCIPVSIKKNRPASAVSAADISPQALLVAKINAQFHQTPITFFEANVLDPHSFLEKVKGPFEVIISNPPYIMASEKKMMARQVIDQEPALALFVEGNDPILFYKKIIDLCAGALLPKGRLYFELNPLTATAVNDYAITSGLFEHTWLINDMSGKTRFFKAARL